MRYAIIRGGGGLPSPDLQSRGLRGAEYDVAFQEIAATRKGQEWLLAHLQRLKAGDEILIWSLGVLLLSTGELVLLLQSLFERGVVVRVAESGRLETLNPPDDAPGILSLLAEHEGRRPSRGSPVRRVRQRRRPLTPYQVKYARQLLRRGASRRSVGLLFQMAPEELSAQLEADDVGGLDAGAA
jgi:hypothetical protein